MILASEALILRQSRWKSLLAFAGSASFVALGLWMISHPEGSSRYSSSSVVLVGWASTLFFACAGLAAIYNFIKPTELILSAKGFEIRGLWGAPFVQWRAVERFFIVKVKHSKSVAYTMAVEAPRQGGLLPGVANSKQKSLPAGLERGADDVCDLMEKWRRRYTSGD